MKTLQGKALHKYLHSLLHYKWIFYGCKGEANRCWTPTFSTKNQFFEALYNCGERRQSSASSRVASSPSRRLEPSEFLPWPLTICSLPRVTDPVKRGWEWVVSLKERQLCNSVSVSDSACFAVAGWAASWGWPSLRTGFVLILARVFLSLCAFLVRVLLFLSAWFNLFRITLSRITLKRSPIGDTKRSLRSRDQTDLRQVSKSVRTRQYSSPRVSLSVPVRDIPASHVLSCLLSFRKINSANYLVSSWAEIK